MIYAVTSDDNVYPSSITLKFPPTVLLGKGSVVAIGIDEVKEFTGVPFTVSPESSAEATALGSGVVNSDQT